jgi:hypothetical protein
LKRASSVGVQASEQLGQLSVFINRSDGFNEFGPVRGIEKLGSAKLFHHLREYDQLVVNALPLLPLFHQMGREIDKILALHLIDIHLAAELLECFENRTVSTECSQAAMILDILFVAIERRG